VGEGLRRAIPKEAWRAALRIMPVSARHHRERGGFQALDIVCNKKFEQIQISTQKRTLSCNLVVKTPATHSQNGR